MPQTQIACPRCRQMIPAQVEQLFDVTTDPGAKQRLVGRQSNYARCPMCGFEGPLATPIVYHDNEKELLLTYFPAELGLPVNEQEKLVGPLISQVMNKLPAEKRKAYLLRPQSFLTFQSLIERILEADGISKETLNEQQKRLDLLQKLMRASSPDVRAEIIKQEQALMDETFFGMFGRLMEAAVQSGQQQTAEMMSALQQELLTQTDYGKKLQAQMGELEAAVKSLQDAGQGLTREKLLEIMLEAPGEDRVKALVSLTRNGLDYSFFQILSDRIEKSSGEQRARLEKLREQVLEYSNQLDKAMEEQMKQADAFIESLLGAKDIAQATAQNINSFNDAVVQVLESKIQQATQKQDAARMQKLQQIVAVLQQASTPPELAIINELVDAAENDDRLDQILKQHEADLDEEMVGMIASLMNQIESQPQQNAESKEIINRLEKIYSKILKMSMKKNLQ